RCLTSKGECDRDELCSAHPVWREAQTALVEVLERYTAKALAENQKKSMEKHQTPDREKAVEKK
ncbi:MAG: hypothetical protein IME96_09125, partial [Proteobacteria bacterium]|nr:hypothetical protein [Pseudomonadota bacterium]